VVVSNWQKKRNQIKQQKTIFYGMHCISAPEKLHNEGHAAIV